MRLSFDIPCRISDEGCLQTFQEGRLSSVVCSNNNVESGSKYQIARIDEALLIKQPKAF
jgi:hypothetical protein